MTIRCDTTCPRFPSTRCALVVGHAGAHATPNGHAWHDDDVEDDVTILRHELATMEARAEKAEQERDEAVRALQEVVDSHDETLRDIASGKYAAEPRALTPGDITDEMVQRGDRAYWDKPGKHSGDRVRAILEAALTEPPARPEELTRLIDTIREATYDPEPVATGEALYNAGVRVVTEERS